MGRIFDRKFCLYGGPRTGAQKLTISRVKMRLIEI